MFCFDRPGPLVVLVAALASACQPAPQPFSSADPATRHPLSAPSAQAGVLVRAIAGAPRPVRLAEAVSTALRKRDVIAVTGAANRASWLLTARAQTVAGDSDPARWQLHLHWFLTDARGRARGEHRQVASVDAAKWQTGEPGTLRAVAEAAAQALAPLFADGGVPAPPPRALVVHDIVGAPGDGAISLRRAIGFAMTKRGFDLRADIADDAIVITATVRVRRTGAAGDDVAITWTALAPDGAQLGTVEQQNRVPTDSLAGAWGISAVHIAEAAAPGLVRLLERSAARAKPATGTRP